MDYLSPYGMSYMPYASTASNFEELRFPPMADSLDNLSTKIAHIALPPYCTVRVGVRLSRPQWYFH